jgi:hypothetical protein
MPTTKWLQSNILTIYPLSAYTPIGQVLRLLWSHNTRPTLPHPQALLPFFQVLISHNPIQSSLGRVTLSSFPVMLVFGGEIPLLQPRRQLRHRDDRFCGRVLKSGSPSRPCPAAELRELDWKRVSHLMCGFEIAMVARVGSALVRQIKREGEEGRKYRVSTFLDTPGVELSSVKE